MSEPKPVFKKFSHDLDDQFRYPKASPTCYGRLPAAACSGDVIWTAVQRREDNREHPLLVRTDRAGRRQIELPSAGNCYQVDLCVDDAGRVHLLYSEVRGERWALVYRVVDGEGEPVGEATEVVTDAGLIRHPSIVCADDGVAMAWSERVDGTLRIRTARLDETGLSPVQVVSSDGHDAHRPWLACGGGRLVLAWDEAVGGAHRVCCSEWSGQGWSDPVFLACENERWFCARASVSPGGRAFLTWVVMVEVTDDLGIAEHLPFAMVGRLADGKVDVLDDPANRTDARIAADFREGLLAAVSYKGYHGLRRNPYVVARDDGVDLFWEMHLEVESEHLFGHLAARRWTDAKGWATPRLVHDHGYAYAVAAAPGRTEAAATYFHYNPDPSDVVKAQWVDPEGGAPYDIDESNWARWHRVEVTPEEKPTQTVIADGTTYRLFWGDTHCHSVLSPDAEGEIDELAGYARYMAGLDVFAAADNDYYPHKELTDAEWRLHRDLAAHYSEPGRFLWMPAYEYGYHRHGRVPDFNHRIVMYPSGDGPIHRRTDPETWLDSDLFRELAKVDCVCYPHHSTYTIENNELDRNVEVVSSWRVVLGELDFTYEQLNKGLKLGFIGSSDSHRAVPGRGGALTGIFATELTLEAIADAYRNRRLIATQGRFVFMELFVDTAFIGEAIVVDHAPTVRGRVIAPVPIAEAVLLRDGEAVRTWAPEEQALEFEWTDEDVTPGEHWYVLCVMQQGDPSYNTDPSQKYDGPFKSDAGTRYPHNLARAQGPAAWTSPVWLTRT